MKMLKRLNAVFLQFSLAIAFFILPQIVHAQNNILLFTGKGKFIEISLAKKDVIRTGNLWKAGIYSVYKTILGQNTNRIYLVSDYSIFILDCHTLNLIKKIDIPTSPSDQINLILSPDESKFVISNVIAGGSKIDTKVYDSKDFSVIKDIDCHSLNKNSHFLNLNSLICFGRINNSRGATILDIETNNILEKINFNSIFEKLPHSGRIAEVDALKNKILFLESNFIRTKQNTQGKSNLYLYDILEKAMPKIIPIEYYGNYKLSPDCKKIIIDEEIIIPMGVNLIKTEKVGKIHIITLEDAKKDMTIEVPKEGKITGFDKEGKLLYWTPKQILLVDIVKGALGKDIPYITESEISGEKLPFDIVAF